MGLARVLRADVTLHCSEIRGHGVGRAGGGGGVEWGVRWGGGEGLFACWLLNVPAAC